MNSKKSFRKAKGGFLRAVAGVAVLIVTAIIAATLLATPASDSGAPSASSSQQAAAGAPVSLAGLTRTFARVLAALTVVVHWRAWGRPARPAQAACHRAARVRGRVPQRERLRRPEGAGPDSQNRLDPENLRRLSEGVPT